MNIGDKSLRRNGRPGKALLRPKGSPFRFAPAVRSRRMFANSSNHCSKFVGLRQTAKNSLNSASKVKKGCTNQSGRNECREREDYGVLFGACLQIKRPLCVGQKHHNFLARRVANKERLRPEMHSTRVSLAAAFPRKVVGERCDGVKPVTVGAISEMAKIAQKEVEQKTFAYAKFADDCN